VKGQEKKVYHDDATPKSEEFYSSHHNINYYQQLLRHHMPKHSSYLKELKVGFLPFYDKENEGRMIFECYQIDQERRVSLTTLSF